MKVDKMIFSCDDPYFFFWKYNSEVVKKTLGLTPVLFYITENEETDFYEDEFGLVKKIKVCKYGSKFQSQIYRMYATKYFQNEVCLIGDIDMFLFNKKWLDHNLSDIGDDDIALLNADAYKENPPRYPMCYISGKGSSFNKIINTNRSFEEYSKELFGRKETKWDTDEKYFSEKLHQNHHGVIYHALKRGYSTSYFAPGRIEKYMFEEPKNNHMFKLSLRGSVDYSPFIDCHVWRLVDIDLLEKVTREIIDSSNKNNNNWWTR